MSSKMYPALYICHGGGPMPVLGDPGHKELNVALKKNMKDIISAHGLPKSIAVVSAHYAKNSPEFGGAAQPGMYYDYGGFPRESYSFQYPAPGNPELAARMAAAVTGAGLKATVDPGKKYDHGVFIPLMLMRPEADIPIVPVCVLRSEDPAEHMAMGRALRPFREEGVFFIGSGASFHHFGNFGVPGAGKRFGDSLTALLCDDAISAEERTARMEKVESLNGFDEAQPRGAHEHLMPLLTLLGTAAGSAAKEVANINWMNTNPRHYLFEN